MPNEFFNPAKDFEKYSIIRPEVLMNDQKAIVGFYINIPKIFMGENGSFLCIDTEVKTKRVIISLLITPNYIQLDTPKDLSEAVLNRHAKHIHDYRDQTNNFRELHLDLDQLDVFLQALFHGFSEKMTPNTPDTIWEVCKGFSKTKPKTITDNICDAFNAIGHPIDDEKEKSSFYCSIL